MNLIDSTESRFKTCLDIMRRKNSDYTNKDDLDNFMLVESLGVASVEEGVFIRMLDKVARIATLLNKEAEVKDETIHDTINDLINYASILAYCLERRNNEVQK